MGRRALVLFWGATAATVLLLGSLWTLTRQLAAGPAHPIEDVVLLAVAGVGLAAASWLPGGSPWWPAGCGLRDEAADHAMTHDTAS
jgi:hypothetical protein